MNSAALRLRRGHDPVRAARRRRSRRLTRLSSLAAARRAWTAFLTGGILAAVTARLAISLFPGPAGEAAR